MHRMIISDLEHKKYHRRIIYVVLIALGILFGGATFYYYIEQWSFLDALYFSTTTMTTVGLGDLAPHTDAGKMFTIVYVLPGVGIVLYAVTLVASHFVEVREEFWPFFSRNSYIDAILISL